jgi:hypothetical protein
MGASLARRRRVLKRRRADLAKLHALMRLRRGAVGLLLRDIDGREAAVRAGLGLGGCGVAPIGRPSCLDALVPRRRACLSPAPFSYSP